MYNLFDECVLHKNQISYFKLLLYDNDVTIFYSGFAVKKSVSSWQYSCVCLVRQNPNFDKVHMAECHFATSILFGPKASQNETFSITDVERNCQRPDEKFTEFKVHKTHKVDSFFIKLFEFLFYNAFIWFILAQIVPSAPI